MKIGITYNLREEVNTSRYVEGSSDDAYEEFDSSSTVEAIGKVLSGHGHQVVDIGFGREALERLLSEKIDFVFNIAEGYFGRSREAHIPAILEMLGIPYSGPDPLTASMTLDKVTAKRVAAQAGVMTPSHMIFWPWQEVDYRKMKFPLILKPAWEGSSKGIRHSSRIQNPDEMESELKRMRTDYRREPIIAEQFISGRELTVGVIGNEDARVLGIMEIKPKMSRKEDFVYSLEVKRNYLKTVEYSCPAELGPQIRMRVEKIALQLFKAFGCRDISRMDFRLDGAGTPYFLEVNVLPGLNPVSGDIVIMAGLLGVGYNELVTRIFENALMRYEGSRR